jgi:hypothetical protein
MLRDYIQWVRDQMKREETPIPAEQKVQEVKTVYVYVSGKEDRPAKKPRKKKINLTVPSKE